MKADLLFIPPPSLLPVWVIYLPFLKIYTAAPGQCAGSRWFEHRPHPLCAESLTAEPARRGSKATPGAPSFDSRPSFR